jgi:hypothetical protein
MLSKTFPHRTETVEIKIKDIKQLFNSFDPSPFLEKDLDDDAVEYITTSFLEYPMKTGIKITVHMPENKKGKFNEDHIKDAIRNFYVYKNIIEDNNIKLKIEEGKKSLYIGLGFLVSCLFIREMITAHLVKNIFTIITSEAFLIFGWVAMWKPISNILYDWWPQKNLKKIYEKISKAEIDFIYT